MGLASIFRKQESVLRDRVNQLENEVIKLRIERDQEQDRLSREKTRMSEQLDKLRSELADLERQRKHESEDIAHLVKIKESQLNIDYQYRAQQNDAAKERAIAKVKDEYRDKLEHQLHGEIERIHEMYGEILERLPNVNVSLKGRAGG